MTDRIEPIRASLEDGDPIETVKTALRTMPVLWHFIGDKAFPGQQISWHNEAKTINYFDPDGDGPSMEDRSGTRVPVVLVAEDRDYTIAIEIARTRTTSFRLRFLADPAGLASFRADYNLKESAIVKLVSVSMDGDQLEDVSDYINISIREDIAPILEGTTNKRLI
jgi:hypothetical protein